MNSALTITSYTQFKQNDTLPILTFDLSEAGEPMDLTASGTTVKVFLKGKTAGIIPTGGGSCTIVNGAHGSCSYTWVSGDTATADVYSVEALVTRTAGTQTVPNAAANNPTITIDPQLDSPVG